MRQEPKYRKRRERGLAVLIAALLLIIGSTIYVGYMRANPPGPSDFSGAGNGKQVLVEIAQGSTVSELGPTLVEKGVVKSNGAFQTAAAKNTKAADVKPGFYRLQEGMSATKAVEALLDPKNAVEMLQIPGGQTLQDVRVVGGQVRKGIYSSIEQVTCKNGSKCVKVADLERVAMSENPANLGVPSWAVEAVNKRGTDPKRLEGLIVPGQYIINPDSDAQAILKDLITKSAAEFEKTGIVQSSQAIGLSPYQVLTAASLVEREAPAGDFDKVARVILNRLKKPMRLEFDSTVNYGLTAQEIATTDEDRKKVTPWNTYAKDGLPDTPIASASTKALQAMEHPAQGNWLFFVTIDKKGTTVFNESFEQHQRDTKRAIDNGVLDSKR